MRNVLTCLVALLGIVPSIPVAALADLAAAPASSGTGIQPGGSAAAVQPADGQTAPSCADPIQPKAVENPKVSIVLDPETAWQPRGGTVSFTVSGNNVSLDGVKAIACFGWPTDNWKDAKFPWEG